MRGWDYVALCETYERAIALDPRLSRAHFNLGELLEASFQYGDAAAHYQKAIVADRQFVKGYNNLSRVLLLEDKATTALRVTDDALKLGPSDPETLTALHKNRAWAEYDLGFYEQALADANLSLQSQPDATAGYCLQGKIYGKVGKRAEAKVAWENFDRLMASPSGPQPMIEPDCIRLAEVSRESH